MNRLSGAFNSALRSAADAIGPKAEPLPITEQSDSRFSRCAYSVDGGRFEVWVDAAYGRIWIRVPGGKEYCMGIGHVEQLQTALVAAIAYLAAGV